MRPNKAETNKCISCVFLSLLWPLLFLTLSHRRCRTYNKFVVGSELLFCTSSNFFNPKINLKYVDVYTFLKALGLYYTFYYMIVLWFVTKIVFFSHVNKKNRFFSADVRELMQYFYFGIIFRY